MSEPITMDEWVAELARLGVGSTDTSDALTAYEIARQLGRSVTWVQRRLREAVACGSVEVTRKQMVDLAGRTTPVPAYRPVVIQQPKPVKIRNRAA